MTKISTTDERLVAEWANLVFTCNLLLVLACTLFPFDFSWEKVAGEFDNPSNLSDIIANVLLFMPFGFGLSCLMQKSKPRGIVALIVVLAASSGLSLTVEVLQVFLPSRTPTPSDIVTNTIGGFLGFVCFRLWRIKILSYASAVIRKSKGCFAVKNLVVGFIAYATLVFLISIPLPSATNLSTWNPNFPLLLGNEKTGDRPWWGYISELAIADKGISPEEVARVFSSQNSFAAIGDSLQAYYHFIGKGSYPDQTGQLPSLSWRGEAPAAQDKTGIFLTPSGWLEASPVTSMTQKLRQTSQFTLSTTIATVDTAQTGPARIISLSNAAHERNFTLGQEGNNLVLRLRTPITGENGLNPQVIVPDVFTDKNFHRVVITYSAPVLRIYIDGLQNLHSFELTPYFTFIRYFSNFPRLYADNMNRYKILYYAIIFIPMGFLLALISIIFRGELIFHILLVCGGILLPPLVLEALLVSRSTRAIALENLILSIATTASAMLLFKVRAKPMLRRLVIGN